MTLVSRSEIKTGERGPSAPQRVAGAPIVGLDLIRFAAALGVVMYHYAFYSWHEPIGETGVRAAIGTAVSFPALVSISWWGWVGVQVFFVISGLVICMSAEQRTPLRFLRSRFLRIAPALWFFATLSLLVTFVYSSAAADAVFAMYARSIVLFPRGPWIDGVYWTLTVEAVFYALILVLIASGWLPRLRSLAFCASVAIFGFYLQLVAARLWPGIPGAGATWALADAYASRVLLLTTGAYFLTGCNLYLLYRNGWDEWTAAAFAANLAAGAAGVWFAAETVAGVLEHARSPAVPVSVWLIAVALLAMSLSFHKSGRGSEATRALARCAGLASYPIYLVHNIIGAFVLGVLLAAGISPIAALWTAIGLCVATSVGFVTWLEPVLRKRLADGLANLRGVLPAVLFPANLKRWDRT